MQTQDRTADILSTHHDAIDAHIQGIQTIHTLEDFWQFKEGLTALMRTVFAQELEGRSDNFLKAFDLTIASKYTHDDQEHVDEKMIEAGRTELRYLLRDRNNVYLHILSQLIRSNKIDQGLVSLADQEDLLTMIESGVYEYFDDLYLQWYPTAITEAQPESMRVSIPEQPIYGGLHDGQIVGYGHFTTRSLDIDRLQDIKNPHIRQYLIQVSELLQEGNTNYDDWVAAEIHESHIWQDSQSRLGFISPMEDYVAGGQLVEPEFVVFLRDLSSQFSYSDFYDLSDKYYDDRYGMDKMTCSRVETILEGGDSTFGGFIGKAFPNDRELSKKEGNNIILKASDMQRTVSSSYPTLQKLIDSPALSADVLYDELLKEVTYHEFGHSLFVKGHASSQMEEAKATLFYYLRVYDEHQGQPYTTQEIEKIIQFALLDSIRNVERLDQPTYAKYVILTRVVLAGLIESGLITMDENKLSLHIDTERFDIFVTRMRDELAMIQSLYALDDETRIPREQVELDRVHQGSEEIVKWMAERIKKAQL